MKSLGISKVNYVCRHYGGTVLEDEIVEIVGEWSSALGDHIMEVLPMDSESRDETVVIKAYNIYRMSPEEVLVYHLNNLECDLFANADYGGEHITEDYVDGYLKALKDIKEAVK
ncbi:hypothetical protein EnPhBC-611_gp33 [Enterococcus phage BC611]|uniref:Uncharacterized protein n=1 Tax=Enterococcus phage BC611 TaxID=1173135 RepID=I4DSK7_9CAUD|nr:hypothetical protein EnPhBC-611_gp33 [Enterococcus phage BC611]BAM20897.2 hypothetical protein [Enterococcus phage BC611]